MPWAPATAGVVAPPRTMAPQWILVGLPLEAGAGSAPDATSGGEAIAGVCVCDGAAMAF